MALECSPGGGAGSKGEESSPGVLNLFFTAERLYRFVCYTETFSYHRIVGFEAD